MIDLIDMRGIPLTGFDFRVRLKDDEDEIFEKIAVLKNIDFSGAVLKHCSFEDGRLFNCNFEKADLLHSNFKNCTINACNFLEANLTGVNMYGSTLAKCDLAGATLRDIKLNSVVLDYKTLFGKILKSEKEKNYQEAFLEHRQIKEAYKNSSLHGLADWHHYREMVTKRKSMSIFHPYRWLSYIFGDLLCKYGNSVVRVFISAMAIVLVCALIYDINDILSSPLNDGPHNFWDTLYFSFITFTTLGYGDYYVTGHLRFLAGIESFIGPAMISLFTVIVGRKIIRD